MANRWVAGFWCVLVGVMAVVPPARAADSEALIKLLIKKGLITEQELQAVQAEAEGQGAKPPAKEAALPVMMDKVGSRLSIKGRWGAGYYHGGNASTDPSGAFRAPEAKVQFAVTPDTVNTIIMRMNLNNATFNNVDYFYLDSKDFLPFLKEYPLSFATRLGRFKMDFGEETWSNNPVESALPSNSIANVAGNDEGLQVALTGKSAWSPRLTLGIFNGNSGTGTDNYDAKAYVAKLSATPLEPLYLSTSFFSSGALKTDATELSIGGLTARPTGAIDWTRRAWEIDARYDIGKGKAKLDPPAYTDSVAYLKGAYGFFDDDATGTSADRQGDYAFLEGLWNITEKWYTAARWSVLDFDRDASATIGNVASVKLQNRYEFGGGYRWSKNTIVKGSWLIDQEDLLVAEADDASNDLLSLIVASQF